MATICRVLAQFFEIGLLQRQRVNNGPGLYFLPQSKPDEQLLGTVCETLISMSGSKVTALLRELAVVHGCKFTSYELTL